MKELEYIKEIVGTLNLESETTLEIVREIMPLMWWKFVWMPAFTFIFAVMIILFIIYIIMKKQYTKKRSR